MVRDGSACKIAFQMCFFIVVNTISLVALILNLVFALNPSAQDVSEYPKNDFMISDKIFPRENFFEIVHKFHSFNLYKEWFLIANWEEFIHELLYVEPLLVLFLMLDYLFAEDAKFEYNVWSSCPVEVIFVQA